MYQALGVYVLENLRNSGGSQRGYNVTHLCRGREPMGSHPAE
jgi:hypothetical protein